MKNFFSRPDELGRSFEQGLSSASSQVKNAAKTVAGDIKQQVKPSQTPKTNESDDWLQALYGRSSTAEKSNPEAPVVESSLADHAETPPPTKDEQRGDQGVEALDPQNQQHGQQQQKHMQHHKTTYFEPLFGEERRKKVKQQEDQEEQVEEQEEEQNKMEELQVKKQKDNDVVARQRTKHETGIGNAGG